MDDKDGKSVPQDSFDENPTDRVRWIDTSAMVCDSLTKDGHERIYDRMIEMLNMGVLRLNATPGSELQKLRQQKQRKDSKL